ncbi:MAG: hypothetical protein K9N11_05485 [Lentisphaeria bacterium]|nr:hypothetical protein [Candidatus Neomarinimicrobiota bacterium]MCF7842284.1 hypothetical protein [Lentisphaeria bacterium]
MSVLIVAALKSEVKILLKTWGITHEEAVEKHAVKYHCSDDIQILRTGVGLAKTARVLNHFQNKRPQRILHIGVCGALTSHFQVGDVVRASAYVNEAGATVTPLSWPISRGSYWGKETVFLSVTEAVRSHAVRQHLSQKTGAGVTDMESFAVAKFCEHHNLPLLSLRIVSDLADETAIPTFMREFRSQAAALQRKILENWVELNGR